MELLSISENHISTDFHNLTYSEQERMAYITGNDLLASCLANAVDLSSEVDCFDEVVDRAKVESFDSLLILS